MAELTLDRMAAGGMRDQVGGGFHRYAVDASGSSRTSRRCCTTTRCWRARTEAHAVTGAGATREVAAETLDYLLRELPLEHGGFASAQDADTEGDEGTTYTWTPGELAEVLDAEAALVEALSASRRTATSRARPCSRACSPRGGGGAPVSRPTARDSRRLLEARANRPQPARDDKALAAWNGMALAAFAEGGARSAGPRPWGGALRGVPARAALVRPTAGSAHAPRRPQRDPGLPRRPRAGRERPARAVPRDGRAALARRGRRLALLAGERFGDDEGGRLLRHAANDAQLVARPRSSRTTRRPRAPPRWPACSCSSPRLAGDDALEARARAVVADAGDLPARAPTAFGNVLCVASALLSDIETVAIAGRADDPAARALGQRGGRGVGTRDDRLARSRACRRGRRAARRLRLPREHVPSTGARARTSCVPS